MAKRKTRSARETSQSKAAKHRADVARTLAAVKRKEQQRDREYDDREQKRKRSREYDYEQWQDADTYYGDEETEY